jgi:hypothetical protein
MDITENILERELLTMWAPKSALVVVQEDFVQKLHAQLTLRGDNQVGWAVSGLGRIWIGSI